MAIFFETDKKNVWLFSFVISHRSPLRWCYWNFNAKYRRRKHDLSFILFFLYLWEVKPLNNGVLLTKQNLSHCFCPVFINNTVSDHFRLSKKKTMLTIYQWRYEVKPHIKETDPGPFLFIAFLWCSWRWQPPWKVWNKIYCDVHFCGMALKGACNWQKKLNSFAIQQNLLT